MINNAILVSGVQLSDSVTHVSILSQILFPFRLLQTIEQSFLCPMVGPYWFEALILSYVKCTHILGLLCL